MSQGEQPASTDQMNAADRLMEAAAFEAFEPGKPWTQELATQVNRKLWRRQVYLGDDENGEDEEKVVQSIDVDIIPTQQQNRHRASDAELQISSASTTTCSAQGVVVVEGAISDERRRGKPRSEGLCRPERGRSREISKPWWSDGKTAPLLADFDGLRRSFYLAQAGLTSLDNEGAAGSISKAAGGRGGIHTYQARLNPKVVTPDSPLERRPALTLIGRANESSGNPFSAVVDSYIAVTPRKKTWDATWGQDGQRATSADIGPRNGDYNSSGKKKRIAAPAASHRTSPAYHSRAFTFGTMRKEARPGV